MTSHQRKRSGFFQACYQDAERLGYEFRNLSKDRVLMQYKDKDYWATITKTYDSQRPWELVVFKGKPASDEPKLRENFQKRVEDFLKRTKGQR